jgi:hypothetical protein
MRPKCCNSSLRRVHDAGNNAYLLFLIILKKKLMHNNNLRYLGAAYLTRENTR